MPIIQVLPQDLINKIAAGEVVERPASIIKELVENAIDAEAQNIIVETRSGGIDFISVRDDGKGMEREDALLATKAHSTSKLHKLDDLFNIHSLGFRGEALASMAAVSRMTLSTMPRSGGEGTRIIDCREDNSGSWSHYRGQTGTAIIIEDLFAKVPARKKFLKSAPAEAAECLSTLKNLALTHMNINLKYIHNDKVVLEVSATDAAASGKGTKNGQLSPLAFRAAQVLGDEARNLIYIDEKLPIAHLQALISPPGLERATAKDIHLFVNHRPIKDGGLRAAIFRGYHSHLLKGKHPICLIYLDIDPGLIDVNVHPAKVEVKFQYAKETYDFVAKSIQRALRQGVWTKISDDEENLNPRESLRTDEVNFSNPVQFPSSTYFEGPHETSLSKAKSTSYQHSLSPHENLSDTDRFRLPIISQPIIEKRLSSEARVSGSSVSEKHNLLRGGPITGKSGLISHYFKEGPPDENPFKHDSTHGKLPFQQMHFIGAFSRCYLLFDYHGDLVVIDQHAFHERIQYELLLKQPALLASKERLLIPESLELDDEHLLALRENADALDKMGFTLHFIDNIVEVRSLPSIVKGRPLHDLMLDLAGKLLEAGKPGMDLLEELSHRLLATIACHSSIRAGEDLSPETLSWLIAEGSKVDFYLNCPHGRRVFKLIKKREVYSWFDRV